MTLETQLALGALPLRARQRTFCRKHGVRATSDPAGRRLAIWTPAEVG